MILMRYPSFSTISQLLDAFWQLSRAFCSSCLEGMMPLGPEAEGCRTAVIALGSHLIWACCILPSLGRRCILALWRSRYLVPADAIGAARRTHIVRPRLHSSTWDRNIGLMSLCHMRSCWKPDEFVSLGFC